MIMVAKAHYEVVEYIPVRCCRSSLVALLNMYRRRELSRLPDD